MGDLGCCHSLKGYILLVVLLYVLPRCPQTSGACTADVCEFSSPSFGQIPTDGISPIAVEVSIEGASNLSKIHNYTFFKHSSLRKLHIENSGLTSIESAAFLGLDNLEKLLLINNELTAIPNLEHICTTLLHLNLSNNEIGTIMQSDFVSCDVLEVVDLGHNNITALDGNSLEGLAALRNYIHRGRALSLIDSKTFNHTPHLKFVDLGDTSIREWPNLSYAGESLEIIILDNCDIEMVNATHVKGLKNVASLHHAGNTLFQDANTILEHLTNLTYINMSSNDIVHISDTAFAESYSVTVLDLSNNTNLITFPILHGSRSTITRLMLNHTAITCIDLVHLHEMTSLESLSLLNATLLTKFPDSGCYQGSVHIPQAEMNFSTPLTLTLAETPLSFFPSITHGIITKLDIANTGINLAASVFTHFPIDWIDLTSNHLEDLPAEFITTYHDMKRMTTNHNSLTSLPSLRPMKEDLVHLDAYWNKIEDISFLCSDGTPDDAWALEVVVLRGNHITDLSCCKSFSHLSKLRSLNLEVNGLITVGTLLSDLKNLQHVSLEGNRLISFVFTSPFPASLKHLHLNENNISRIISQMDAKFLPTGLVVRLQDNPVHCTAGLCWLKSQDIVERLVLEDMTCAHPGDLANISFSNISVSDLNCYGTYMRLPTNETSSPFILTDMSGGRLDQVHREIQTGTADECVAFCLQVLGENCTRIAYLADDHQSSSNCLV